MRLARKSGALFVVMALLLGACGGSAPKPTVVTITSPAPNAQVDVGKGIIIKGVATGDNIVRVDILVDSKLYGS
ncbi:MAG TPA: Ig-like domain-containing protein, partial [Thermoflexales bacterium]|nr:Ig-like domain-containing protein [Thermoflexales bacterium]